MTTRYCSRCLTTFTGDPDSCTNLGCGSERPSSGWGALLSPGELLDRHYLVEKVLAVGGAGLTYLAREVDSSGNPVDPLLAIKVLYTQRDSGSFLRRLANEAQILQELNHPYIVQCRGFVHRQGRAPYLVTLFETGGTVAELVARSGPLSARAACGVLKQLLMALDTAHQRGVIHRDLKPENLLVHESGHSGDIPDIRVADFGIAKMDGAMGAALTRHGTFVGTPEYAAPEQFERGELAPATDVFAAGSVLLFLLTGTTPWSFSNRHDVEQCRAELLASLPPRLERGPWSEEEHTILQSVVSGMMAQAPTGRWTIQQVIAAIQPLLDTVGSASFTDRGASPRAFRAPPEVAWQASFDPKRTLAGDGKATLSDLSESLGAGQAVVTPAVQPSKGHTEWIARAPESTPVAKQGDRRPWSMVLGLFAVIVSGVLALGAVLGLTLWAGGAVDSSASIDLDIPQNEAERNVVLRQLEQLAVDASRLCGASGTLRLSMTLSRAGEVQSLELDPGWGSEGERSCLERALGATSFSTSPARLRSISAAVDLDRAGQKEDQRR